MIEYFGRPKSWARQINHGDIVDSDKIDYEQLSQLIGKLVSGLCAALKMKIQDYAISETDYAGDKVALFFGYVWGFSDVMVQHTGMKTSGIVSQGIFAGIIRYFLAESTEVALAQLEKLASSRDPEFIQGIEAGGEDASDFRAGHTEMRRLKESFTKS